MSTEQTLRDAEQRAWDEGVRQAMTWLRADYEYGTGPDWREQGAEWIADRLADHNRADRVAVDAPEGGELAERGRQLANEREELIARGIDPSALAVPIHPDDEIARRREAKQ